MGGSGAEYGEMLLSRKSNTISGLSEDMHKLTERVNLLTAKLQMTLFTPGLGIMLTGFIQAITGKAIVRAFYGKDASFSYWNG